jgi:signal transduction histidine kinase
VQGLVVQMSDLTLRKEQEAEQARKERLAAIGELSGHLAHEIRNSLKPLVGSVELLEGEMPRDGNAGELVGIILREAESLEAFLSDFLAFSRDKTLTVRDFDLDELIDEQIAALSRHPAHKVGVALKWVPVESGEVLRTDRDAVRDILRNLVINALEATAEGGVRLFCNVAGPDIELVVEDTGIGLPEGDPEQLFEPFRTYKAGGTGLGLSVARRRARQLSGEVVLERRSNVGSRSRLLLRACRVEHRAA